MSQDIVSVLALFDEDGSDVLKNYRKLFEGISNLNYLPHLTLALYDRPINMEELDKWVDDFCENHHKFTIKLMAVGSFNESNIFILPGVSSKLQEFYNDFHKKFTDKCRSFFRPSDNEWIPHIGLYYTNIVEGKKRFPMLMDVFKPSECMIHRIRISMKSEEGYVIVSEKELSSF